MKQIIIRLDDELHARLEGQAAAEGRGVNEFVVAALTPVLGGSTPRRAFRERARATGRLVVPEPPETTPSWHEVDAISRESGIAVIEALEADRSARW
jgi:plasmid stability protein